MCQCHFVTIQLESFCKQQQQRDHVFTRIPNSSATGFQQHQCGGSNGKTFSGITTEAGVPRKIICKFYDNCILYLWLRDVYQSDKKHSHPFLSIIISSLIPIFLNYFLSFFAQGRNNSNKKHYFSLLLVHIIRKQKCSIYHFDLFFLIDMHFPDELFYVQLNLSISMSPLQFGLRVSTPYHNSFYPFFNYPFTSF